MRQIRSWMRSTADSLDSKTKFFTNDTSHKVAPKECTEQKYATSTLSTRINKRTANFLYTGYFQSILLVTQYTYKCNLQKPNISSLLYCGLLKINYLKSCANWRGKTYRVWSIIHKLESSEKIPNTVNNLSNYLISPWQRSKIIYSTFLTLYG